MAYSTSIFVAGFLIENVLHVLDVVYCGLVLPYGDTDLGQDWFR